MPVEKCSTQNANDCTTGNYDSKMVNQNLEDMLPPFLGPTLIGTSTPPQKSNTTPEEHIAKGGTGTSLSGMLLQPITTTTPVTSSLAVKVSVPSSSAFTRRFTSRLASTSTTSNIAPTLARTWSNAGSSKPQRHHTRQLHTSTHNAATPEHSTSSFEAVSAGLVSSTLGMLAIDAFCQMLRYGIDHQQHLRTSRNKFIKDETSRPHHHHDKSSLRTTETAMASPDGPLPLSTQKTPSKVPSSYSHPKSPPPLKKASSTMDGVTSPLAASSVFACPPTPSPPQVVVARGLVNRGQTCYLNCILQALASCPPFLRYLHCISSVAAMQKHRQMMEFEDGGAGGMSLFFDTDKDSDRLNNTFSSAADHHHSYQEELLSDVLLRTLVSLGGTFSTETNLCGTTTKDPPSASSSWGLRCKVSCAPPLDPTDVLCMVALRSKQFRGTRCNGSTTTERQPRRVVSVGQHMLLSPSPSKNVTSTSDQQQDAEELLQSLLDSVTEEASRSDVLRIGSGGVELSLMTEGFGNEEGNAAMNHNDENALCVTASIGECGRGTDMDENDNGDDDVTVGIGNSQYLDGGDVDESCGDDDSSSHSSLGSLSLSAILREMEREEEKRKCERRSRRRRRRQQETPNESPAPAPDCNSQGEVTKVVMNGNHINNGDFGSETGELVGVVQAKATVGIQSINEIGNVGHCDPLVVDGSDVDDGEEKKCGDINVWHHRRRERENDPTMTSETDTFVMYENNSTDQGKSVLAHMNSETQQPKSDAGVTRPLVERDTSTPAAACMPQEFAVSVKNSPSMDSGAAACNPTCKKAAGREAAADVRDVDHDTRKDYEPLRSTESSASSSAGMMRMISELTTTSPTPLTGWLGSCLQCCACHHVRPIHNAPFVDIPVVPTAVTNYLTRATYGEKRRRHRNSSPGSSSPSSVLPSCTLEQCLESFTCVERVEDVDCINCAIQERVKQLDEEIALLSDAVEYCADNSSIGLKEELLSFVSRRDILVALDPDDSCGIDAYLREEEESRSRSKRGGVVGHDLGLVGEDEELLFDDYLEEGGNEKAALSALPPLLRPKRKSAFKCLLLTRLPSVLCFHLQRRYYDATRDRMNKAVQHVSFPEILDVSNYCAYSGARMRRSASAAWAGHGRSHCVGAEADGKGSGSAQKGTNGGIPYRLMSVVEHKGTAHGGHYQTYRRVVSSAAENGNRNVGRWVRVSDANVSYVDWKEVRRCQAYMLFYEAM